MAAGHFLTSTSITPRPRSGAAHRFHFVPGPALSPDTRVPGDKETPDLEMTWGREDFLVISSLPESFVGKFKHFFTKFRLIRWKLGNYKATLMIN